MDADQLRRHRAHMEMLRRVEPADRFAYAMYQAHCVGAEGVVEEWDRLTPEDRAGWRAAADFAAMYTQMMEVDSIVRAL